MVYYLDVQNVPFMMSPSASALSHRRSATAGTPATGAVLRDTTQYYRSFEGPCWSKNIALCVLLWVAVMDVLRLLSATREYSGSIAGLVACVEFERIWKWSWPKRRNIYLFFRDNKDTRNYS